MLTRIRKKQLSLSHGLIILLLCSWMSYAWMPCFACNESVGVHLNATVKKSCHSMQDRQKCHHRDASGRPINDHCNCHFHVEAVASNPNAQLIAATNQGLDLLPPLAFVAELRPFQVMRVSHVNYLVPERAHTPPFDRYTVLLN